MADDTKPIPKWVREFREKFQGGLAHTFVLHGAVDDYIGDQRTRLDHYLTDLLGQNRCVVFYNVSRGINFASPAHHKAFFEVIDISDSDRPAFGNLFLPEAHKALPIIERAMRSPAMKAKMAVIIEYPELVWPDSDYGHLGQADRINLATLRRWASTSEFVDANQVILLVCPTVTDLHSSLRQTSSMIETVEIPFPSAEDRAAFIAQRLGEEDRKGRPVTLADGITVPVFAGLTGGLSRVLVDDIILRALLTGEPVSQNLIKDRKDQIIRQEFGELIEILEPRHGFDQVGGMTEIKDYLRRSVISPLRGEAPRDRMPSGVMLAGPPGTGKTLLVSALAREAGVNVVKLNAGRLLGQYVGNSERNLEKALACIRSLAPTLVMIDEIEQQFQRGGSGDSGVERRIFGRILEEMSGASGTRRGDVVWFAATNRIDMVDAALRRPGRFDRIVPILPPTAAERYEILRTKLPAGTQITSQDELDRILKGTEAYTGADLDGVIIKAVELAYDAQRSAPTGQDLLEALALLRPSTSGDEVASMTQLALAYCNDLSLVPPAWRDRVTTVQAASG